MAEQQARTLHYRVNQVRQDVRLIHNQTSFNNPRSSIVLWAPAHEGGRQPVNRPIDAKARPTMNPQQATIETRAEKGRPMTEISLGLTIDRLRMSSGHSDNCALRHAKACGRKWAEEVADYSALERLASLVETRKYLAELMQENDPPAPSSPVQKKSAAIEYRCGGNPTPSEDGFCSCFDEPIKPVMAAFVDGALAVWQEVKGKV